MKSVLGKEQSMQWIVEIEHTAYEVGSGGMNVLATPILLAWMEHAAYILAQEEMDEGNTTVGVHVDLQHLAATPVGARVTVVARMTKMDGRKITFSIEASDDHELIGSCTHQRFIVDESKFMTKCQSKIS